MSGTRAFDVKDRFVEILSGIPLTNWGQQVTLVHSVHTDLDASGERPAVSIGYGPPSVSDERPREVIWAGEIEWTDEDDVAVGANSRVEEFDMAVMIEVHNPGDTQRDANKRAEELMFVVEAVLRDPRWTALPNIQKAALRPRILGEGQEGDGRAVKLLALLRVRARK